MRKIANHTFATLLVLVVLASCDTTGGLESMNDYEQQELLDNLGNNYIVPAYNQLSQNTKTLEADVEALVSNPSLESLEKARESLFNARVAWQYCAPIQLGPAEMQGLSADLNIYPIDRMQVESNIKSGEYNLNTLSNSDARGFQTLGYLLYSGETAQIILDSLSNQARGQYALDVAGSISASAATVYEEWSTDYISVFTSEGAMGVDAGSSVAKLVNAMNLNFERNTRDGKIGIPVGFRSLGETIPEATEAYFSGYSVALLEHAMIAYQNIYNGISLDGTEGEGFDDYLEAIDAVDTGEEDLEVKIQTQLDAVNREVAVLEDPLPQFIASNKAEVEQVFAEMQRLVVLLKTDLASSLGVVIAYQDNDGD